MLHMVEARSTTKCSHQTSSHGSHNFYSRRGVPQNAVIKLLPVRATNFSCLPITNLVWNLQNICQRSLRTLRCYMVCVFYFLSFLLNVMISNNNILLTYHIKLYRRSIICFHCIMEAKWKQMYTRGSLAVLRFRYSLLPPECCWGLLVFTD